MYLSDVYLFVCFVFVFVFTICENIIQAHKKYYYSKIVNFLLKATTRGLSVESPKVLSVPGMWQGFSLLCLKFVISRSDYS